MSMITALKKHDGICFECKDGLSSFKITHSEAGYEIAFMGDHYRSIPESDAIALVNRYLGVE